MGEYIQVITTVTSIEDAERIAGDLLERKLAACIQVGGPVTSLYRWQGKVEKEKEYQCLIKSRRSSYPALEARIREIHPYEEPEILAVPVIAGSKTYLDWLDEQIDSR